MSVWGQIISPLEVEQAIKNTLQAWLDSALTESERRSDQWRLREIPRPVRWEVVTGIDEIEDWPDRELPAVIVESTGKDNDPQLGPDGQVDGAFAMNVTTIYRGSEKHVNRERNRRIVVMLATAVELVLLKAPAGFGIDASVIIGETAYDIASPTKPRTLSGAQTPIVVLVGHVANRFGLPAEPDPPDQDPPSQSPDDPDHLSTHVLVDAVAVNEPVQPAEITPPDPTGANVSIVFGMPVAVPGPSGAYTVRTQTFIDRVSLTCATAPTGSPLTVQVLRNGAVIATLSVPATTTTPAVQPLSVAVSAGDLITVNALSVGSDTAATGVIAQVDLND